MAFASKLFEYLHFLRSPNSKLEQRVYEIEGRFRGGSRAVPFRGTIVSVVRRGVGEIMILTPH